MNVLVTGGAGFIGSHVADAYLARGDRVWVVDDLSAGRERNVPGSAEFVRMDVRDPGLSDLFASVRFDLVNHHAAQIDVRTSVMDPRLDASINIDGLLNVLEAALRHGTRRVVFVSSGGVVYGEPEQRPTPECAPKLPLSPYGVTKLAAEFYLHYYHRIHGLDYIALRYSNVFGPRQDPHGEAGVVAIFSQRILAGQPLIIYGDGEQTRDYVYVGDVARASLILGEAPMGQAGSLDARAFNIGTSRETSVNRLAEILQTVAGRQVGTRHADARPGELRNSCLDTSRAAAKGWSADTALTDGLRTTFTFIAEREGKPA
ncbi:MAG: NAD-dependent epimerase/dehydratase family protein [Gemmatimonadetes bacterium]|nr:NAD-dependent epimerase/dehydratase family protein [Gemmatimonadota bacterium]